MARERRIDVRFDGPTLQQIEEIERLSGKSVLAILRESVNLSNWLYKERRNGARLLLLEGSDDPALREVVFES
jgi:hypothetical protein